MKDINEFYNFAQDLMIDLQNKPNKFIDLDSLINQLIEIRSKHGNSKVAIATDRCLKFTYLYRVNDEGQVETECLYPHKNKTLGCTVHHVFIPVDMNHCKDHEMDRYVFCTGIAISHSAFDYVSIQCIGDDGCMYEAAIDNNEIIILTHYEFSRDINMKIIETFIVPEDKATETAPTEEENTEEEFTGGVVFKWPAMTEEEENRRLGIDIPHNNPKPITADVSHIPVKR